jgi:large subunit ribosomal protein L23
VDNCNIIIRPLITEQSTHFANTLNAYSFKVNKGVNKFEIKKAVEELYDVKVDSVRTMNRSGKARRRGRSIGRTASWKKAIVVLNKKDKIDLF